MGRGAVVVLVLAGIGILVWVRDRRQQDEPVPPVDSTHQPTLTTPDPTPEGPIAITLTVEKARRLEAPVLVEWLDATGGSLGSQTLRGALARLEPLEGVAQLRVSSPGHHPETLNWPTVGHVHVVLRAAGGDSDVFSRDVTDPSTTGPVDCPLRLVDARTGRLLANVEVLLDGVVVGRTGEVGELGVPFKQLEAASRLALRHPDYRLLEVVLDAGHIDELQVEPLLLEPR